MQSGDIEGLEHSSIDIDAKRTVLYGWDSVNLAYTRISCDTNGKLKIDTSASDLRYLKLDQSVTQQTVAGGMPSFTSGIYLAAGAHKSLLISQELWLSGQDDGYDFDTDLNCNGQTPFTDFFFFLHKISTDTYPFSIDYLGNVTGLSFTIGANKLTTSEFAYLDGQNQAVKTTSNPTFASVTIPTIYPTAGILTIMGNLVVDNGSPSDNNSTLTLTGGVGLTSTILAISSATTDKTITFPNLTGVPLLTTSGTPTVYMPLCGATANPGVIQSVATGQPAYPLCYNSSSSLPSFQICGVPGGGTGTISFTAYMPICGGTTTTNPFQSVATGTIYYPLCYNTSSTKPTFQLLDLRGGGTGRASDTAYALISGGTTTTAAQVSIANSATVGAIFRGAGTSAYAGWSLATITESGNDVTLTAAGAGTITLAPGTASSDPYWLSPSGKIGLGGTAITNNESLLFDFETTANIVGVSSATGVTEIIFTGITLTAPYFEISTAPTANSSGTVAIVAKDANLLTANSGWLPLKTNAGTVVYIPYWA
jgi:hypothetical protein